LAFAAKNIIGVIGANSIFDFLFYIGKNNINNILKKVIIGALVANIVLNIKVLNIDKGIIGN